MQSGALLATPLSAQERMVTATRFFVSAVTTVAESKDASTYQDLRYALENLKDSVGIFLSHHVKSRPNQSSISGYASIAEFRASENRDLNHSLPVVVKRKASSAVMAIATTTPKKRARVSTKGGRDDEDQERGGTDLGHSDNEEEEEEDEETEEDRNFVVDGDEVGGDLDLSAYRRMNTAMGPVQRVPRARSVSAEPEQVDSRASAAQKSTPAGPKKKRIGPTRKTLDNFQLLADEKKFSHIAQICGAKILYRAAQKLGVIPPISVMSNAVNNCMALISPAERDRLVEFAKKLNDTGIFTEPVIPNIVLAHFKELWKGDDSQFNTLKTALCKGDAGLLTAKSHVPPCLWFLDNPFATFSTMRACYLLNKQYFIEAKDLLTEGWWYTPMADGKHQLSPTTPFGAGENFLHPKIGARDLYYAQPKDWEPDQRVSDTPLDVLVTPHYICQTEQYCNVLRLHTEMPSAVIALSRDRAASPSASEGEEDEEEEEEKNRKGASAKKGAKGDDDREVQKKAQKLLAQEEKQKAAREEEEARLKAENQKKREDKEKRESSKKAKEAKEQEAARAKKEQAEKEEAEREAALEASEAKLKEDKKRKKEANRKAEKNTTPADADTITSQLPFAEETSDNGELQY